MQRSSTAPPPQVHVAHAHESETPQAQSSSTRVGRRMGTPLRAGIAGLAALLAIALLLFVYSLAHDGRVYRGVHVLGKDLGGLSRADAQAALVAASTGYPSEGLNVAGEGHSWALKPADVGLAVDVDKTVAAAMQVGRGSFPQNLRAQISSFFGGSQVQPALKYDPAQVEKAVAAIAAEVDRPATDSKLEQGADGTVHVTASSIGMVVDRNSTRDALLSALAAMPASVSSPVKLTMQQAAPRVTEAALQNAEAHALLLTGQPVTLTSGKQTWTISPDELRGMLAISSPSEGSTEATVSLPNNSIAAYLQPIAEKVQVDPKDASVQIGKGTVTLKPDVPGSELDTPAAITAIQSAAAQQDPEQRTVSLPAKTVEANIHTADVQATYDKANSLVTQGMRLRFRDDGYIMRGTSVTGFIDVVRAQGGPSYALTIDEDVLADRISGVAYNINRSSNDARFRMVNGVPTKIAEAKEGYKVNVNKSLQNALAAINSYSGGDRLQVDLDVTVTQPTLTDADLSTINTPDLLGTGQTSYAISSPERAWNVGLGTRNVDGALVPPGGTFSTVEAIGDLTLAAGFKMGYAIVSTGNGGLTTVPAEAGGICQVATTLFHSVFWAGLPVVERNWHSYWISLYGVAPSGLQGLDATIAPPEKDFRFKNTTGNWILIKATADGKNVTFQLYGVNPGWKVSVSGPVITGRVKTSLEPIVEYSSALSASKGKVMVEHAQDGFSASITRVVKDSSGNTIDNWTAVSHYAPAHNRYLIGTGK